jgi:hypothetical protein
MAVRRYWKETVMSTQKTPDGKALRLFPPAPKDFDALVATTEELKRHGLPRRPDPHTEPGLAALWERQARRYHGFDHLVPDIDVATSGENALGPFLGLEPVESCGYSLFSTQSTFGVLFLTWTVPDLEYSPSPSGTNQFHTFVGLGGLDVHVEMTVDPANNVTSYLWASGVGNINLPVKPGDLLSGTLCLEANPQGTATYFLANETTGQTMNLFLEETGLPPAVTVNAGVTRSGASDQPPDFNSLARFGAVYFDEISVYSSTGPRLLTSGQATTMVNESGATLATPVILNEYAFKTVYAA